MHVVFSVIDEAGCGKLANFPKTPFAPMALKGPYSRLSALNGWTTNRTRSREEGRARERRGDELVTYASRSLTKKAK